MDKKIFNKIYANFSKKDYFMNKEYIRKRLKDFPDYIIKFGEIKGYLKNKKKQCYIMMEKRLLEYNAGIKYPQRENFTWAVIKELEKQRG